jgi:hypothetical protein
VSNLTSTVPSAFNSLYGLLVAAGNSQSPVIPVYHTVLGPYEPDQYVVLGQTPSGRRAVENHQFELAALGSYAQYETYVINGYVTYFQGNVDQQTVMTSAWALYQNVVMSTVVANRGSGGFVLADSSNPVSWMLPEFAEYTGEPGTSSDGIDGFVGTIEFGLSVKARITVP